MHIGDVVERSAPSLMANSGVIGVGEGEVGGQPVVLVMVTHLTPAVERLPEEIDGFPVKVDVIGEVGAFPEE